MSLNEQVRVPSHDVLADQHEKARAFIQNVAAGKAFDRIIEPELRKVGINAVARREPFIECLALKSATGLDRLRVVFG